MTRRAKGRAGIGTSRPGAASRQPQEPEHVLRFRTLPPGVSGADLVAESLDKLQPGAVWLRGLQRVRIRAVTQTTVTFAELSHGWAKCRSLPRAAFLRSSSPE